jgi:hypothetical protein
MSNPRLTNLDGTNSTDYLPLWQMPVTYYQALSILITATFPNWCLLQR